MYSTDYAVVCLSVCHIRVLYRKYICKLFSLPYIPAILGFPYQTLWQYSDGDLPLWGRRMHVGYKKSRFLTNISL